MAGIADTLTLLVAWIALFVVGRWFLGFLFPQRGPAVGMAGVHGIAHTGRPGGGAGLPAVGGGGGGGFGRNAPLTAQLQEQVNQVAIMFPHISRQAIDADMRRTGSAQITIENILNGRVQQPRAPDETPAGIPAPNSPSSYVNLIKKMDQGQEAVPEPPKLWSSDSDQRQSLLAQRKQFMLQQARSKFLNKGTEEDTVAGSPSTRSAATMARADATPISAPNVAEATSSASPSQSRETMRQRTLEAAQRRNTPHAAVTD